MLPGPGFASNPPEKAEKALSHREDVFYEFWFLSRSKIWGGQCEVVRGNRTHLSPPLSVPLTFPRFLHPFFHIFKIDFVCVGGVWWEANVPGMVGRPEDNFWVLGLVSGDVRIDVSIFPCRAVSLAPPSSFLFGFGVIGVFFK